MSGSALQALFSLRAWRQHSTTDDRGTRAMRRLGINLPTADWRAAWRQIQGHTVAALAAVREEVDALTDTMPMMQLGSGAARPSLRATAQRGTGSD